MFSNFNLRVEGVGLNSVVNTSDNSITIDAPIGTNRIATVCNVFLEGGKTYTISRKYSVISGTPTVHTGYLRVRNSDYVIYNDIVQSSNSVTITPPKSDLYKLMFFVTGSTTSTTPLVVKFYDIQIEVGNAPTTFEPYKGDITNIPYTLNNISDTVYDSIEKQSNGTYKLIQRIKEVILDGSADENFTTSVPLATTLWFQMPSNAKISATNLTANVISSAFKSTSADLLYSQDIEGIAINNSSMIQMRISKHRLTTQDAVGFKTWLASNPITILYELATPIETVISIDPVIETYLTTTNIFTDASAPVKLDASIFSRLYGDLRSAIIEKVDIYVSETLPNTEDRKAKTIYFKVTDTVSSSIDGIVVSPNMGITLV